jgi:2,3-bisphosphoglycerate-independent phosphoglycerate mutase
MNNNLNKRPLVLCILDGVGISINKRNNAVKSAKMPVFNGLMSKFPNVLLDASGAAVGLPPKTMGNSEVGHITIGSGRTVNQFLRRFQLENIAKNKPLDKFIKSTRGFVHFVGLCSDGKVHSDLNDALAVAKVVKRRGKRIVWHFVADGRDVDSKSALKYVHKIRSTLGRDVIFASLAGRYYTMDRNENWDRSLLGFDAVFGNMKETDLTIEQAIQRSYRNGKTDEFIEPVHFVAPVVGKDDGILFFNYRADRARQFLKLVIKAKHKNILCFSQYGDGLDKYCPALLPDIPIKNTLGDILEANKISQLRLAETEKYNHVTNIFDSERMVDYKGEQKILVPSPKVATFDLKPEMSAPEITKEFLKNIGKFDVVIMNYANGDMVGHTGSMPATIKAMETLDACLGKIVPAVLKLDGTILITADHGNAEKMSDWRGRKWTAHTTNRVPFICVSNKKIVLKKLRNMGLANIAPTMLKLLGVKKSKEMTESLV